MSRRTANVSWRWCRLCAAGQKAQNHVIFLLNLFGELRWRVPGGRKMIRSSGSPNGDVP